MRLLIAVFSTGWLLPMWVSGSCLFGFLHGEAWPLLLGQHPQNSLDVLRLSEQVFTVGCVWLAAVVFFWAWRLSGATKERTGGSQSG
jgi:hypothetical protein